MKIKRIISIPFAAIADVATLGKFGEGSFMRDIFEAEKQEQKNKCDIENLKLAIEILKALNL